MGRLSCFEFGALPGSNYSVLPVRCIKKPSFFFLCGIDNFVVKHIDDFVVFQGSFQSNFFNFVNLVFPIYLYIERISFFLNLEGRFRKSQKIVSSFKYVSDDIDLVKTLFFLKLFFFPDNLSLFKDFKFMSLFFVNIIDYSCSFFNFLSFISKINNLGLDLFAPFLYCFLFINKNSIYFVNSLFSRVFSNYYNTDNFTDNSKIMSICFLKTPHSNFSNHVLEKSNYL